MNQAVPTAQPQNPPVGAPPLGGQVLRGSFWMMINSVAAKGASLVAQVVLAWLLTKHDFGVFATASSAAVFATFLRDGGVRDLLIQRQREHAELLGPVFWMAATMNLACGALVMLIGAVLAWALQNPVYFWMLLLIGVSVPLNTLPSILSVRLNIELRFQDLARVQIVSALVRYGSTIALAAAGVGPLAFVLPLPLLALVEWLMLQRVVSDAPWRQRAHSERWPTLLGQVKWILVGTLGVALVNMGNYSAVRVFVDETVVGVYFFAFQLVAQIGVLVAANMNQVLFAAFAKIDDPDRLRRAIDKSIRQLMFIAAPTGLVLVPVFPGLERLIWQGKWAVAVPTVLVIAVFYPLTVINAVPYAALQAWGRFRAWALLLTGLGGAILIAGMLGAFFGGTTEWIGLCSIITFVLGCVAMTWLALRPIRVSLREILMNCLPAWVIGLIAAAAGWLIDDELAKVVWSQVWLGAVIRVAIGGAAFSMIYGVLALFLIPAHVREAIQILPARLKEVAQRVPGIRETKS